MSNKLFRSLLALVFASGCTSLHADSNTSATLASDKRLIVGIWAMQALNEGQTTVAEFKPDGQLLMHAFDCVKSTRAPTNVVAYSVSDDGQVINMILPTKTIELKVLTFSPQAMQFTSRTDGMEIRYDLEKVDKVDAVCDRYPQLKAEQARMTPYKASDFIADPTIPAHPDMDRYVGKWSSSNFVMYEIARDVNGGFYLTTPRDKNWHYLYNDVHWVGNALHFQLYTYSDHEEAFRLPKHKLLIPTSLEPMLDGRMREDFILNGDPYMSFLKRMK
ncbi:hypothetical protein J1G35_13705 [Pseudomonas sp. SH10-3B]|uniref:hypothetical protein n=1 Tax=Pseudomonas sp. SH10-3B TaxID=2816049 RepID=UPI001CA63BC2|nr:hypothetical protein [Pseudomonas sp. SH10-3B]MBY8946919.1 hypothetical protein [Pseudomonas sp. SH10-3B]